jgi:hypothetical protein
MNDLKHLFQPKPKKAEEIAQAEKMLDLAADKARVCIGYDDFKHYKQAYEQAERTTTDLLIGFSKNFIEGQGGQDRYAMVMLRLTTKLEVLRYLLKTIESNAKRGLEDAK